MTAPTKLQSGQQYSTCYTLNKTVNLVVHSTGILGGVAPHLGAIFHFSDPALGTGGVYRHPSGIFRFVPTKFRLLPPSSASAKWLFGIGFLKFRFSPTEFRELLLRCQWKTFGRAEFPPLSEVEIFGEILSK